MNGNRNLQLRKFARGCAIIFLSVVIAKAPAFGEAMDKVRIGWIGPLTGPVRFLGVDNLNAVQLAIEEYAGEKGSVPIDFAFEDDQYDANTSASKYSDLRAGGTVHILFLSTYNSTINLADTAKKDGVTIINPIDNDAKLAGLNRNIFLIGKRT